MEGTKEHIATVQAIAEDKYFEEAQGLYIDSSSQDFKTVSPYRGQNANMHMCEAQIALFEALGQKQYLERATMIAHRLVVELPTKAGKDRTYLQLPLRQWGSGNVYLLVLSSRVSTIWEILDYQKAVQTT